MEEKKKVTFEPVSAEEAKKIRANGVGENSYSDIESGSGVSPADACINKRKGDSCSSNQGSGTCQWSGDILVCTNKILA